VADSRVPLSLRGTTLVFDGDCGFCTTAVTWLEHTLPVFPPATPFQWADLESLGLTEAEARDRVWLVTPDHQYGGHLAVSAMLRRQPSAAWRLLGWFMVAPVISMFSAVVYALVARYRYRLPGGTPACRMPRS
jgi:predicted DCC family thiol-disulfide oxidoreductase YuxK